MQACAFHVECNATRDFTVDFLPFVLFLLCDNNVQVCAFHVDCNVTRDVTVDFLLYLSKFFHMHPHVILAVWN